MTTEENCSPTFKLTVALTLTLTVAIFLGGNYPDTINDESRKTTVIFSTFYV